MTNKSLVVALFSLGLFVLLTSYKYDKAPSLQDIHKRFLGDFDKMISMVDDMNKSISELSHEEAQQRFLKLRRQFKSLEPLLTYYAEPDYNLYLNGAPLPKLEPNVPDVQVIEPQGMQVLDEEIFGDFNRQNTKELLTQLSYALNKVKIVTSVHSINKRMLLEAIRSELIRVVALGLSGFDTPGSGSFHHDAVAVLDVLDYYLQLFKPTMNTDEKVVFDHIASLKKKLQDVDEASDLDFTDLIRNHIDPIYGITLDYHLRSGIEHVNEVMEVNTALNYYSKSIFANDFLHISNFINTASSDIREDRIELGKKLFYDPIMSEAGKQTCATCHDPSMGFADGKRVSTITHGDTKVSRNSPTLLNSMYTRRFFHDMRAKNPDLQVDHVVYNEDEFNTDYSKIIERLKKDKKYSKAFAKSYGFLNRYAITNAITQFVGSLSSLDSPFDRYMRRESDKLAKDIKAGFNLFMGKGTCASCHFVPVFNGTIPPAFQDSESEILGVLANNDFENPILDEDPGRVANGDVRQASEIYHRSFKTPTVRNAALTAPYMHNGVHNTLEEVISFYNFGGGQGMGLDVPYQTLPPDSLHLSEIEIQQLVTFMEALTDTVGLTAIPVLE